jgi:hypothetical protein
LCNKWLKMRKAGTFSNFGTKNVTDPPDRGRC